MANPLQAAADSAMMQLPYAFSRLGIPKVLPAAPGSDSQMRAGVEEGNAVSPIYVGDASHWTNPDYTPQLLRHEMTHQLQNNWPQKIQNALPPVNPSDPYDYGGAAGLQKIGGDPTKMSREESAAAEQEIQAMQQRGEKIPSIYKTFDQNLAKVPLSVMQPTDPNQAGINTMARTPGLPAGYDSATGKILQAQDVLPVSGATPQAPWEKYAAQASSPSEDGPWTKYGSAAAQPSPAAPPDTRNALQKMVDTAAEPDSAEVRAKQGPIANALSAFGKGTTQTLVQPLVHPLESAKGMAKSLGHLDPYDPENPIVQAGNSVVNDFRQNGASVAIPHAFGQAAGMFIGGALGDEAADAAQPFLEKMGSAAQRGGEGIVNRTIGASKSDFKRGANPGAGYFQARLGPSSSIGSIASKANNALDSTGEAIGDAIDNGAGAGVRIPAMKAATAIGTPINRAFDVLSGPGGGSVVPLEDLSETFRPPLRRALDEGGFTPRQLFDVKRNVGQNTSWGDPSQIGLKSVRQQITGGLSGTLADEVPELRPLNSRYQNLTKLAERTGYRSDTGSIPLTQMGRRGMEALGGAGIGMATHHPLLAALPLAMDSVPVRTGIASGLFYGGEAAPALSSAFRVASPAAAVTRIPKIEPYEKNKQ